MTVWGTGFSDSRGSPKKKKKNWVIIKNSNLVNYSLDIFILEWVDKSALRVDWLWSYKLPAVYTRNWTHRVEINHNELIMKDEEQAGYSCSSLYSDEIS